MNFLKNHIWIPIFSTVFVLAVGAYSALTPRLYEVSGTVVIHRQRVENPNASGEEEKNRWIWVRDGMGLKESLLSDRIWLTAVTENPLLKARYEEFLSRNGSLVAGSKKLGATEEDLLVSFAQGLVKQVSVDFTGGDSYSYVLRAKDKDPHFAKALVTTLIGRTEQKLVQDSQKAYQDSLSSIQRTIDKTKNDDLRWYLKHTEKQLRLSSILFDSSSSSRVEVVRTPHIPLEPVWPKPLLLVLVALLFGVTVGLLIEVSLSYMKSRHAIA